MEKRRLVFDEVTKRKERKRVRNFTIATIIIGLILCILVSPLCCIKNYKKEKKEIQKYISISKEIWYEGIKDIPYNEIRIKILDLNNVEYKNVYEKGICNIYDKVQLVMCIENIEIIQESSNITITKGSREIVTIQFNSHGNEKEVEVNKITYVILEIFIIISYMFLAYMSITIYKSAAYKRMVIDMSKNNVSNLILIKKEENK